MTVLRFEVMGRPAPAGSKRAFVNPHTGRAAVVDSSGARGRSWREDVRAAASEALSRYQGPALFDRALAVEFVFLRARPKSHYGTGRNAAVLKGSAPRHPVTRPDLLKVSRAIEDACTGLLWRDDAQIVRELLHKRWAERDGVAVVVWAL